jgi:hypothetical protein
MRTDVTWRVECVDKRFVSNLSSVSAVLPIDTMIPGIPVAIVVDSTSKRSLCMENAFC